MRRSLVLFTTLLAVGYQMCLAEMDWENLILREYATDQDHASDLLKEELYSLQYDATMTVGYFISSRDREKELAEYLSGYRMDQYYLTDGTTEFAFYLALTPSILSLILPEKNPVQVVVPALCPTCGQEWPAGKEYPKGLKLQPKEIEKEKYTGIVIDCTELKINPCFFPKVVNENMQEVYSFNFADSLRVADHGLVSYSSSMDLENELIGNNPMRIRALATLGANQTDIKISLADSRRIHGSQNNLRLLRECRVAIISGQ